MLVVALLVSSVAGLHTDRLEVPGQGAGVEVDAHPQRKFRMREGMTDEKSFAQMRGGAVEGGQEFRAGASLKHTRVENMHEDNGHPVKHSEGRIVMLPGKGCSGTTFIWTMMWDLLQAHGERIFWPCKHSKEFLHDKKLCLASPYCLGEDGSKVFWPKDPLERLEAAHNLLNGKSPCKDGLETLESHSTNGTGSRVMVFYGNSADDVQAAAVDFLARDPRNAVAGTVRANSLRHTICMAQDGWGGAGYQVYENGTKSDLGIERRSSSEKVMVKLNAGKIQAILRRKAKLLAGGQQFPSGQLAEALTKHGIAADFVTFEDLAAYEYNAEDMPRSLEAWATLLTRAGVKVQPELVKAALRPGAGTRTEKPLKDVIYNYDEVRSAVADASPEFLPMLEQGF